MPALHLRGLGARIGCDPTPAEWVKARRATVQPIGTTMRLLPGIGARVACAVPANTNRLVARPGVTRPGVTRRSRKRIVHLCLL
nr:hypothetical protein [uncultured Rhodopila sp.]